MTKAPTKAPEAPAKSFLSRPPGWWRARRYYLLAPLVALVVVYFFEKTNLAELIEDQTINLRFKARAAFDPHADSRLVLVGVDQYSLDFYKKWPWPRTTHTTFLNSLALANGAPRVVAYDILFTESSSDPKIDQDFGDAAGLLPCVITGALSERPPEDPAVLQNVENKTIEDFKDAGPTQPITHVNGDVQEIRGSKIAALPAEPLRKQSLFGFVNDEPSSIDAIRHIIPLIIRVDDKVYPSFALQILCQTLSVDPGKVTVNVGQNVVLNDISNKTYTIPINARGEYLINYRRQSSFTNLSFRLLASSLGVAARDGTPLPPECDVKNKTILFGQVATGLDDLGPTPLDAQSPLVYTHLNVINNVLNHDYLKLVPMWVVVLGWALVTWPTLLRLKDAPLGEAVLMPILTALVYVAIGFGIFAMWSIQIALAWPVLAYGAVNFGGVVLRWREEQKGRQQVKQVFSQMLSPEVMGHLLDHPENIKMGGSKRAVTILFSDIRDYTKFSEGLDDEELVRQINTYFEQMVNCIKECNGTLHKFIGDAIMSVWGDIASATKGVAKDAQNAVRSALLMRRRLRELNEARAALSLSPIRIGIGLNHGTVLVGLIGALSRSEFTVMGDAVNTASRLEGITKEFHTDLAISESVKLLIGEDFLVRRLGFIQLKGKTQATLVYEVISEKPHVETTKMSQGNVERYERGFDHFLARRFAEAEATFVECLEDYPDDFCTQNYLKASREFEVNPPPPAWDGRIVMTTK